MGEERMYARSDFIADNCPVEENEKEEMIKAIIHALKDHGVDWILNERYPNEPTKPFDDLMEEIELAIKKYKVVFR